jgi:hypothetical protein
LRAVGALAEPVQQLSCRLNASVDVDLRRALDVDPSVAALDLETSAALHLSSGHAAHLPHRACVMPAAVLAALPLFAVAFCTLAAAGVPVAIVQLGAIIAPIVIALRGAPIGLVIASVPIGRLSKAGRSKKCSRKGGNEREGCEFHDGCSRMVPGYEGCSAPTLL